MWPRCIWELIRTLSSLRDSIWARPGAIVFRPFGTQFAPARLRVPVRTGWAATGGCPYRGKRTPGNTTIFVSLCLGVKYDAMDTASHKDTKEDHSGIAAVCFVARARMVPHRTRTGTWSKRRPRRDYVSPFGPVCLVFAGGYRI